MKFLIQHNKLPEYLEMQENPSAALDSAGGAYSTPPDPFAGGEGIAAQSPFIPPPLWALWPKLR